MPHGRTLFVWQEQPYDAWSEGWDAVCVKVADGNAPSAAGVFDWAGNANAWKNAAGGHQVGVWVYCYPDDGASVGQVVKEHAPWADYVVLDIEDASGGTWTTDNTDAIVNGVRAALPGMPVGFCTYPTRQQATDHGVAFDALVGTCDFSVPQVYYPYQRAELAQVYADNNTTFPAVSPDDDAGWLTVATDSVHHASAVFVWRAGMADTRTWGEQIPQPAPPAPPPAADDPLRPAGFGPVPFTVPYVAWDGTGWWMTDAIHRVTLSQSEAAGALGAGLVVRHWPECAGQTGLVVRG